ncbi:two pore potassium channel protein sup-9 [Periplaneta americana]|uniref:two pore potassium channel protein sup-9 n=1 Tax=Periplaneta americana TaxID=6978 RepID=UPI0037E790B5
MKAECQVVRPEIARVGSMAASVGELFQWSASHRLKMRSIGGTGVRSSVRSRGSSSTTASDPREKVKDCCRKLVAFMCTQVGVGGLVVGYAIVGAVGFVAVEKDWINPQNQVVANLHSRCAYDIWNLTTSDFAFNETAWRNEVDRVLKVFQNGFAKAYKDGYNGRTNEDLWTFPAALMFCLAIFTMIGYGNIVPRTPLGRGLTVLYAVFGIPLYVLYFMNMGKVLASTFRWLYTRLYECSEEGIDEDSENNLPPSPAPRIIVPSTAGLWVIGGYVLTGTIMFAEWEEWEYLDSTYFCVTSLCKIGIGDFVPGANIHSSGSQTKLIINFVYLLIGMGLIAMCFNLMREEIRVKMRELREEMKQWLEDTRVRIVSKYRRKRGH